MDFSFNPDHAMQYGVNEAIVIRVLAGWIHKNRTDGRHSHDGKTWTYNTIAGWREHFPFWSVEQMRRVIDSLKAKGVLVTGNYNKTTWDRTVWYAFSDESIFLPRQIHMSKSPNGSAENNETIPEELPELHNQNSKRPPNPLEGGSVRKRFVKPSLEEIKDYCKERGNSVNPDRWLAHYEANDWHVGRNKMKDWKAAIRTWEHNDFVQPKAKEQSNDSWRFSDPRADRLKREAAHAV